MDTTALIGCAIVGVIWFVGKAVAGAKKRAAAQERQRRRQYGQWKPFNEYFPEPEFDDPLPKKTRPLPPEGERVTADAPPLKGNPPARRPRVQASDLRRAVVWSEILRRKY